MRYGKVVPFSIHGEANEFKASISEDVQVAIRTLHHYSVVVLTSRDRLSFEYSYVRR